ncbi:MAG: Tad domain-containing protein [Planctomycetales bacterium]
MLFLPKPSTERNRARERRWAPSLSGFARRLHGDERGAISVVSVVVILGLTILLGMVINVGRHLDEKKKMQDAADAATYSGGVVLARGMNAIAYSNHLLCDIFALTAYMREARDQNAARHVPDILQAWSNLAPIFGQSSFPKFQRLGPAIAEKTKLEQRLVDDWSSMSAAVSKLMLPVLEYVLRERLIPEFARAVVQTTPHLAQEATQEIARRHGQTRRERRRQAQPAPNAPPGWANRNSRPPQLAVLWRTNGDPVGYPCEQDPMTRTLPAYDPTPAQGAGATGGGAASGGNQGTADPHPDPLEGKDARSVPNNDAFLAQALAIREQTSKNYLEQWTADRLRFFTREAKMSQFINLWRTLTCAQLERLLHEEYPLANLPHLIRPTEQGYDPETLRASENQPLINEYLDRHFTFVGIVYRTKLPETFPGVFKNRIDPDSQTFAQIALFIPQARMWRVMAGGGRPGSPGPGANDTNIGGGFGVDVSLPANPDPVNPGAPGGGSTPTHQFVSENWPHHWDLWNQHWHVQLTPVVSERIVDLLQAQPPEGVLSQPTPLRLPALGGVTPRDVRLINTH